LHDEEKDPAGKNGTVEMNDGCGQRRAEDASKEISVGEADEDADENEKRHRGEEQVVVASTRDSPRGDGYRGGDGGQCVSRAE
jgi:hypothetical protein